MSKFKVGDTVKILAKSNDWTGDYKHMGHSCIGEVAVVKDTYYSLFSDDRDEYFGIFDAEELQLLENPREEGSENKIESQSNMENLNKLTKEQKAGLSQENQDLLAKGYINTDLTLTDKGKDAINDMLYAERREDLAKQAAKEIAEIKAEEKAKKAVAK